MGYIAAVVQFLKIIGKVFDLFTEKNKKKAAAKKEALDKLTNAAKETDKKKRASKLNRVLDRAKRLR